MGTQSRAQETIAPSRASGPIPGHAIPTLSDCPVTGLPIRHSKDWIIEAAGEQPYHAEFSLIGSNIVHAHINGFTTLAISKRYLAVLDRLCEEHIPAGEGVVTIEDYSLHRGTDSEARNNYINHRKSSSRLRATIFVGADVFFRTMIRVARLFVRGPFAVELAPDYATAIRLAIDFLPNALASMRVVPASLLPSVARVWDLEAGELRVRFEVLPEGVLVTRAQGSLTTIDQVRAFEAKYREVMLQWIGPGKPYARLIDFTGLTHHGWSARRAYLRTCRRLHQEFPCKVVAGFGLGTVNRSLFRISQRLFAIPILEVQNEEEGLDILRSRGIPPVTGNLPAVPANQESVSPREVEQQVRDLVDLISTITWEQTGVPITEESLSSAGLFRPLYEALMVLKYDYDENLRKRMAAEAEQHQLEKQLKHAERMQTMGTLAGGIAHDFNNMLSGISGFASLLRIKHGKTSPDIIRYADQILEATNRASSIIGQLLAFSRQQRNETVRIEVKQFITETVALLSHTIDKRISIVANPGNEELCVSGDRGLLQNAVLNLALNAADAMPGGGTLTLAVHRLYVDEQTNPGLVIPLNPGEYVCIEVVDTGTGIPPEIRDRIFEPFFTTKDPGKGTGLGLSSVYGTMQNHGGSISVRSEIGKGSAFALYLRSVETPKVADARGPAPLGSGSRARILVVDDEPSVRAVVNELLAELGHTVTVCCDGVDAVECVQKHPHDFDLAIVDMIMPRMNGADCIKRLFEINPALRVVISTGFPGQIDINELRKLGAAECLMKPYTVQMMHETIQRVCATISAPR